MVYQVSAGYAVGGREIKVPQIFIPSVMRTIILATTPEGTDQLNIFHTVTATPPVTLLDCQQVNSAVRQWVEDHYAPCFADRINVYAIHTRSMEGLIVPTSTLATNLDGELAGDVLPYSVTLPIEFTTGETGPSNKGMFYPFTPTEAQNDANGRPVGAYLALVTNAAVELRAALIADSHPLVVASFTYSEVSEVSESVIRTRWGKQGRRLIQVGS